MRDTFRYTPIVAALLQPNEYFGCFGKLLFCSCDIAVGYLIYRICKAQGCDVKTSTVCAMLWLFNPLTFTVSSRGNAESLVAAIVLSCLYVFTNSATDRSVVFGGLLFGLSVHTKIYPITYSLPLYMFLSGGEHDRGFLAKIRKIFRPNRRQLLLVVSSVAAFVCLTSYFYFR